MKKSVAYLTAICIILLISMITAKARNNAETPVATTQVFYDDLAPYGVWLHDKRYGYVWLPYEDDGFRPYYTNGYWAMTEHGNTWISFYRWGWAVFHYGRWTYDSYYGWLWIPGSQWGPAWVNWRYNNDVYGWAPLSPGTEVNANLNYDCPPDWWVFVPKHEIYNARTTTRYNAAENAGRLKQTTSLDNFYYNAAANVAYATGPSSEEVCTITKGIICEETEQNVLVHKMEQLTRAATTTIRNCIIYIYRPYIYEENDPKRTPKPRNFIEAPRPVNAPGSSSGIIKRPPFRDRRETQQQKLRPGG